MGRILVRFYKALGIRFFFGGGGGGGETAAINDSGCLFIFYCSVTSVCGISSEDFAWFGSGVRNLIMDKA